MVKKDRWVTFSAKLEESQKEAFVVYLLKNYAGVTTSDKFRSLLAHLLSGDLVLKAEAVKEIAVEKSLKVQWLCIRGLKIMPSQREYFCKKCRERSKSQYEACQQLKKEASRL